VACERVKPKLTYYCSQHNRYLWRRHCRPNYTWRPSNSNKQTTNKFKQNPTMVGKMAY